MPGKRPSIPIVAPTTVDALRAQYANNCGDGQTWGDRLTQMQKSLTANPELMRFVESQVGKYPSEVHVPMFEVVCATLVVLESQMQVDSMTKQFEGL